MAQTKEQATLDELWRRISKYEDLVRAPASRFIIAQETARLLSEILQGKWRAPE